MADNVQGLSADHGTPVEANTIEHTVIKLIQPCGADAAERKMNFPQSRLITSRQVTHFPAARSLSRIPKLAGFETVAVGQRTGKFSRMLNQPLLGGNGIRL
jgi:hypothetical protein